MSSEIYKIVPDQYKKSKNCESVTLNLWRWCHRELAVITYHPAPLILIPKSKTVHYFKTPLLFSLFTFPSLDSQNSIMSWTCAAGCDLGRGQKVDAEIQIVWDHLKHLRRCVFFCSERHHGQSRGDADRRVEHISWCVSFTDLLEQV